MPVIQVPFSNSLAKISTSRGRVTQSTVDHAPVVDEKSAIAAEKTLDAIGNRLRALEQQVHDELLSVRSKVTAAATQIAKEALGSDDSLIEQRVTHFADVLLQQIQPTQRTVIYVSACCVDSLKHLVSESDPTGIEIQPDPTVQPGDCRIETDGKGFLASLDSYLDAAAKQKHSVRGGI